MEQEKRKITKEEKVLRLLEYLRKYTDKYNPASLPQIERYFASKGYPNFFGNKNTRKNIIREVVRVMNSDINGNILPRNDWRICYNDFVKINEPGEQVPKEHHIVDIYYEAEFSDDEIRKIISSVKKNNELSDEVRNILLEKIDRYLKNENYNKPPMTPAQRKADERRKKESDALFKFWVEKKRQYSEWD